MKAFIAELPYYLIWSVVLFCVGIVFGVATPFIAPGVTQGVIGDLSALVEGLADASATEQFLFVFINNTVKAFGAVLFGVLLGIAPITFLLVNGFVIGLVSVLSITQSGVVVTGAAILPHGIVEVPALLLSSAAGLVLGVHLIKRIRRQTDVSVTTQLIRACRFFVAVLVPLLLVAAILEIYVTPFVIDQVTDSQVPQSELDAGAV